MKEIIIIFTVSIISGLLSLRTMKRFWDGKIKTEWSLEYLIFGYVGLLVFIFGTSISIYSYIMEFII